MGIVSLFLFHLLHAIIIMMEQILPRMAGISGPRYTAVAYCARKDTPPTIVPSKMFLSLPEPVHV